MPRLALLATLATLALATLALAAPAGAVTRPPQVTVGDGGGGTINLPQCGGIGYAYGATIVADSDGYRYIFECVPDEHWIVLGYFRL